MKNPDRAIQPDPSAHLAAIIESSEDAIISKDLDGTITSWNPAAERMFGWSAQEAVGQPITIIVPEDRREEEAAMLARILRGSVVQHYDTVRRRKDGAPVDISLALSPIKDSRGNIVGASKIARDISSRKRTEAQFRDFVEAAPDGIVIVDHEGKIVIVNSQTERLFGYPRTELLGRGIELLVPPRFARRHVEHRAGYLADPKVRSMGSGLELYGLHRDGTEFPVEISLSPLKTDEGVLTMSTIRDISDRKAAEAERRRLLHERAAHAETHRVKDEFLATLSHELRTPLNAILGWTALLLDKGLDLSRTKHALITIQRNARAQAQLVEDLLDLSRVISGKLRIEMAPADLAQVVEAAADVVRPSAQARDIHVDVEIDRRPIFILGDADRLQQAVWNMLANAVKFTPEGGRIEARVRTGATRASVTVRDTGQGIDPEFLPHIFERFRQEDSSSTRAHGGLGLGLALVKSIVQAHGGTVHALSAGHGMGATIGFEIPIGMAIERRFAPDRSAEVAVDLHGINVLIVDDSADERELLSEILAQAGASVRSAGTAAAALTIVSEALPDVIVSDIAMPGEDGYVFMRRLRAHENRTIATTPAIAVTAHARVEDRHNALAAGFHRYIAKPVVPSDLVRTVAALRARRSSV